MADRSEPNPRAALAVRITLAVVAALLIIYSIGAAIGGMASNEWFVSTNDQGIGINCNPEDYEKCDEPLPDDVMGGMNLTNDFSVEQKSVSGLLLVSVCLGAASLLFSFWAIFCGVCCPLRAGGVLGGVFLLLQFSCILCAVVIFAESWEWGTPPGYTIGPAYIFVIAAIPCTFIAMSLGGVQHCINRRHNRQDEEGEVPDWKRPPDFLPLSHAGKSGAATDHVIIAPTPSSVSVD